MIYTFRKTYHELSSYSCLFINLHNSCSCWLSSCWHYSRCCDMSDAMRLAMLVELQLQHRSFFYTHTAYTDIALFQRTSVLMNYYWIMRMSYWFLFYIIYIYIHFQKEFITFHWYILFSILLVKQSKHVPFQLRI